MGNDNSFGYWIDLYVLMSIIIEQLLLNLLNQEILNTGFVLLYKNEYFCQDIAKEGSD